MNPAFWILVVLSLIAVWFMAGGYFKRIGDIVLSLFQNAVDGMSEESEKMEDEDL